jgi:hypothetical protein
MEIQSDSWVMETQSTLKGVTTDSLKGQHSRIRRAKARENWYNSGVANNGQLIKPFKFVDQQELGRQKNSKLLSSIRSHVKQDTYVKRQAANAALGSKKTNARHLLVLPKVDPIVPSWMQLGAINYVLPEDESNSDATQRQHLRTGSYLSNSKSQAAVLGGWWRHDPLNTFGGYGPLNHPRALFLLCHCKYALQLVMQFLLMTY